MRVLTLVPNVLKFSPGQRGSIELWESFLSTNDIELDFVPFETPQLTKIVYTNGKYFKKGIEMIKAYAKRIAVMGELDKYDAVFVYREAALLGPAFLEKYIAKRKPIIYQLDDPLFVPYKSPTSGYFSYLKFFGKIKEIIKISKVVIVNSTPIREYAQQFNTNIWQIPSLVDTSKFTFEPRANKVNVCVGWSGSPSTAKNMKLVEEPLRKVSDQNVCDIHLIGSDKFDLSGVNFTSQKWFEKTEVEDLRKIDIGLIPLPDFPWNKYKFIMKTAQYMALGIVPVGTTMASNPEVIRHGENGFLADTNEEWFKYISLLATDDELRSKLSIAAAADAEAHFSLNGNKEKIIGAFRSALL